VWATIDYDNILVVDSVHDNVIAGHNICEGEALSLTGSAAAGGIGALTYRWEESGDGQIWTAAPGTNTLQSYHDPHFSSPEYFRRIVTDTLFYADTSAAVYIRTVPWPVPVITPDTAVCAGETIHLRVSGADAFQWSTGSADTVIAVSPAADTRYTVILTNEGQCVRDTSVTVTVHPLPEVDLGEDTTVCEGGSVTLDAGDFAGYRWSTGEDVRQVTVGATGYYSVSVTDEHGCTDADTVYVEFTVCTGTGAEKAGKIIVFPNPSRGVITISGLPVAEVVRLEVLDASGRTVTVVRPQQDAVQIDLQHESAGLFFIRVFLRNGQMKVVKVRKE